MENNIIQPESQTEPTPIIPTNPINPPENQSSSASTSAKALADKKAMEDKGKNEKKLAKVNFKISLKIIITVVIIVALILLAYFYKSLLIAATVNGSPISRLTVIQKLEKDSGKALLDSLITEKLIKNEAAVKNIVITDNQINEEIKKIEAQIVAQGGTLEIALSAQNMTMEDLKKRIFLQKEIEGIVADKINVTDQEIAQYIKDNEIAVATGQEAIINGQIKTELINQKLSTEADALIAGLKAEANIQYFVNY